MLFYRFCVSIRGLGTRLLCSSNMADLKGSALVILAEGAEEMEAVITTDVLRRGKVSWRTSASSSLQESSFVDSLVRSPLLALKRFSRSMKRLWTWKKNYQRYNWSNERRPPRAERKKSNGEGAQKKKTAKPLSERWQIEKAEQTRVRIRMISWHFSHLHFSKVVN